MYRHLLLLFFLFFFFLGVIGYWQPFPKNESFEKKIVSKDELQKRHVRRSFSPILPLINFDHSIEDISKLKNLLKRLNSHSKEKD